MSAKKGFTLVELLIVVGIIALLIALIMPSLGRARDLAKKAVCATQLRSYGSSVLIWVTDHGTYPHMGTVDFPVGWPMMYGVLQSMRVEPPFKRFWGSGADQISLWGYQTWELDEVYDKVFCPAMDEVRLIRSVDAWTAAGLNVSGKASYHRAAAGYQWNVTLRAPGRSMPKFSSGRWPIAPWRPDVPWGDFDNTLWIEFPLNLVVPGPFVCQAINSDEIEQPANVAHGWDSWDIDSLPGIDWSSSATNGLWGALEKLAPGWHVGAQSYEGSGWALLNGGRHPSGPNILYADGHAASDAMKEITGSQLPGLPGGLSWAGAKIVSWEDFDADFGTMHHIVPERSFTTNP